MAKSPLMLFASAGVMQYRVTSGRAAAPVRVVSHWPGCTRSAAATTTAVIRVIAKKRIRPV